MDYEKLEVPVEDANAPLIVVFKPDYLRSTDLICRSLRITPWHSYAFAVVKRKLKNTQTQQGATFIRRRIIKHGLGVLERDNHKEIDLLTKQYETFLGNYERKKYCEFFQNHLTVGDTTFFDKASIYMEEDDYGRISDLSDILHMTQSTIMRIAIAYTILTLDCFTDGIRVEANDDVSSFKKAIVKLCL